MNLGTIAISGLSGCGNTSVSSQLAKHLELPLYNYTFRNLAKDRGTSLDQIAYEAEQSDKWDMYIDNRIREYTNTHRCIIGSRLAIWFATHTRLRVYIDLSLEERARRIALREGCEYSEAYDKTKIRDARDIARYKRLYNIDILDFVSQVDFVLSDVSLSVSQICYRIIQRLEKRSNPTATNLRTDQEPRSTN